MAAAAQSSDAAMLWSSAVRFGEEFIEAVTTDAVELTLLVAVIGVFCIQRKQRGDAKLFGMPPRDRHLASLAICAAAALALPLQPILVAAAFMFSLAVVALQRHMAQQIKKKTVHGKLSQPKAPRQSEVVAQSSKPALRRTKPVTTGTNTAWVRQLAESSQSHLAGDDAHVRAILKTCKPTTTDEVLAQQIAKVAAKRIAAVIPEAQVEAVVFGNLAMLAACGSQPEVDLVVTCAPDVLAARLKQYFLTCAGPRDTSLRSLSPMPLLVKTATKTLSEQLTFVRYWRTQLNSPECKTVHVVPKDFGLRDYPVYLNFSVNTPYPLRMSKLLSQQSPRATELIMFVRLWARERCVSNVARGQFSLYTWGTLALYFCREKMETQTVEKRIIDCFHEFVKFYADLFRNDGAPSLCFASEAQPPQKQGAGPYIEDALEPGHNLSETTNEEGMFRVNEELQRSCTILSRGGGNAVSELMERWTKPTSGASAQSSG